MRREESGLMDVPHPSFTASTGRNTNEENRSGSSQKQSVDDGIESLAPPTLRGSRSDPKPRGKEEKENVKFYEEIDEEAAKPNFDAPDASATTYSAPVVSRDLPVEQTKNQEDLPRKGRRSWSRRTWLILCAVLVIVLIAVIVPIAVTQSGSSSGTKDSSEGESSGSTPSPSPEESFIDTENFNETGFVNVTSSEAGPLFMDELTGNDMPSFVIPKRVSALDENLLRFTRLSAELCHIVNLQDTENVLPEADVFLDEPDKALVVQVENICFGVFRATTATIEDWRTNLARGMEEVCSSSSGDCCNAKTAFTSSYNTTREEFEEAFNQCVQDCPDCEVVFAGASQGGAIAQVAAIIFAHLDPTVVTFGQPYVLEHPCRPIDASRVFRFINTIVRRGKILYDPIPYIGKSDRLNHAGHLFVLGEDLNSVAYYADGEDLDLGRGEIAIRFFTAAHLLLQYRARFLRMQRNGVPVRIDGFGISQVCHDPTECEFPHLCGRRRCSRGEVADPCDEDADCLSGICAARACT